MPLTLILISASHSEYYYANKYVESNFENTQCRFYQNWESKERKQQIPSYELGLRQKKTESINFRFLWWRGGDLNSLQPEADKNPAPKKIMV